MTRQARIGLLVGLAFIIMFGLVLSEIINSPEPAPATRADVPPVAAAPVRPPEPPAVEVVDASDRSRDRADAGRAVPEAQRQARPGDRPSGEAPMLAAREGNRPESARTTPRVQHAGAPPAAVPRTHKVQPGDSLIALARRYYGPDKEHLYERIFQANRHILSDPGNLSVGQELIIPPLTPARSAPAAPLRPAPAAPGRPVLAPAPIRPAPGPQTYTVRPGDSLCRIAERLFGDGSRAAAMRIYNANRDKLRSPDVVPVGVELVIPR